MSDFDHKPFVGKVEQDQSSEAVIGTRPTSSTGHLNRVVHGANEFHQDLTGWRVARVKEVNRSVLNCSYFAEALIDGVSVPVSTTLKSGQQLEFLKRFGYKGSGKVPRAILEARGLLNAYPEVTRIVTDTLGRGPTIEESDVAAVVLKFCTEKFGRPNQEAIPVLEEVMRMLSTLVRNPRDDRITNANLNDSERAIVEAVRMAGHRLTTMKLLDTFVAAKNSPGDSTAKGHLANLVKRGILINCSKCRPKGYGLPGWLHDCLDPVWTD